ncbi:ribonuclease HII [Leptolyngbya sp. 7M]|nr:ribonuclease HII [Leptolyngbya sp. 7M]
MGFGFEEQALLEGFCLIAGVDEVGRGCLAGPVVAAACILDRSKSVPAGLTDSKKLSEKRRTEIAAELRESAISYAIGVVEAEEIDRINILEATKKAMSIAVNSLSPAPDHLIIDALHLREINIPQKAIIKGDSISYSIAAASVIAKVYRDELMCSLDREFPGYGFARHKGYGTSIHFDAIRRLGPTPLHRKTFRGAQPAIYTDIPKLNK